MVGTRSDVRDLRGQTFSEDFEGSNLAAHYPEFGCRRRLPGYEHIGQGWKPSCGLLYGYNGDGCHSW